MRLAWERAALDDPDFYLWMNDDTVLLPDAPEVLFRVWDEVSSFAERRAIIVGACRDPDRHTRTYGGYRRPGRHPARLVPVASTDHWIECDTFNGNIVLVPREVVRVVGMIRPFAHAIGDVDYGLRAKSAGCRVILAPGFLGECLLNTTAEEFLRLPFPRRLLNVFSRKIYPPVSWFRFYWAHAGFMAIVYWPASLIGWLWRKGRRPAGVSQR